ncbi:hypothetical protein [Nitrobacter sp. TKz-YC01]|uniref:hypothetical protein n=1 Tax=Nitrobacter sp. TKz-YC01 TaxID=3398703 RepID=UPI003A0FD33C
MALPKPSASDLKIKMTERGMLRVYFKGEPLPGVIGIECIQDDLTRPAEVRVTFSGRAVALDIEGA